MWVSQKGYFYVEGDRVVFLRAEKAFLEIKSALQKSSVLFLHVFRF